jgi:hypothetical protein
MSLHLDRGAAPVHDGPASTALRIGPWSRRNLQRETSWFKLVDFDPMQTVPDSRSRPFSLCVTTAKNTWSTLQWRRHPVSRPSFLCFQIEDLCAHLRLAHQEAPGALVRMVPVWRIDQFSSRSDQFGRRSGLNGPNAYVALSRSTIISACTRCPTLPIICDASCTPTSTARTSTFSNADVSLQDIKTMPWQLLLRRPLRPPSIWQVMAPASSSTRPAQLTTSPSALLPSTPRVV